MKKLLSLFALVVLSVTLIACGGNAAPATNEPVKDIPELVVYFVPSRDPEEIITATAPLANILKTQLAERGFNVDNVRIEVGTSFDAVGQAMAAGTADIGFIPGGTYVLFENEVTGILTATRAGLNKDSGVARDWNDGLPTTPTDTQVDSYRAIIIAGPSARGQELAQIINNGGELTWDQINEANWAVLAPSSPAGFIYPNVLLTSLFGHGFNDLAHITQVDGYATSMTMLASGQIDLMPIFADGRQSWATNWTEDFGRDASIWDETNVVFVTEPIFNDTISVSNESPNMSPELITALQEIFMALPETQEGRDIIAVYNHQGYKIFNSANYDSTRAAQEFLRNAQ